MPTPPVPLTSEVIDVSAVRPLPKSVGNAALLVRARNQLKLLGEFHDSFGEGRMACVKCPRSQECESAFDSYNIDTVAGISEFEDKNKEAMSELTRVDSKISESRVVLAERGAYLSELEKERDAALKHLEAKEQMERARATLLDAEYK